jgi:hypothetical protein
MHDIEQLFISRDPHVICWRNKTNQTARDLWLERVPAHDSEQTRIADLLSLEEGMVQPEVAHTD